MKLLEKILVPMDFSPGAEDALQVAVLVAKQFQSEITLLQSVGAVLPGCWWGESAERSPGKCPAR